MRYDVISISDMVVPGTRIIASWISRPRSGRWHYGGDIGHLEAGIEMYPSLSTDPRNNLMFSDGGEIRRPFIGR